MGGVAWGEAAETREIESTFDDMRPHQTCYAPYCNLPARWELESVKCKMMRVCSKHKQLLSRAMESNRAPYFKAREIANTPMGSALILRTDD